MNGFTSKPEIRYFGCCQTSNFWWVVDFDPRHSGRRWSPFNEALAMFNSEAQIHKGLWDQLLAALKSCLKDVVCTWLTHRFRCFVAYHSSICVVQILANQLSQNCIHCCLTLDLGSKTMRSSWTSFHVKLPLECFRDRSAIVGNFWRLCFRRGLSASMRRREEKLGKQEGSNGFAGKLEPPSWLPQFFAISGLLRPIAGK